MEYIVISYGGGEILDSTFNAIAALINSNSGSLYKPLVRFSLTIGLVWATATMVYGDRAKFINQWTLPFTLMLNLFFAPTCTVIIKDPVTNYTKNVDNVPWGLGMIAGVISHIGDQLTQKIEQTFSLPDDVLKYQKAGPAMASKLISNARKFQITNTDLKENLKNFMTQCVVYDALIGTKYTLDDLKKSPNIWALISKNPSPARAFSFKPLEKGKAAKIITCQEGVTLLKPLIKTESDNAFKLLDRKIFGGRDTSKLSAPATDSLLKTYLPGALNYMTGMAKTAQEYMWQQMMIHSVVDSIENKSTELGNAPNAAVRRAYLTQRANQETIFGIAAQKLIAMKTVMEAIIYSAFIFILPMALLPLGWRYVSRWVGLVMWVQLWPPLYAILNYIVNISARAKGIGAIYDPSGSGITIANSVGFMDLHADMAAQAGFMSLAVGALAYALVKGGAASFVHLASHMAGPSTSAASAATESMMSGNYSFGNVTSGTVSANNTTFGQQNHSPNYSSGSFTQNDGVVSRTTGADGSHMVQVSNSTLRSSVNWSESLSESLSKQASEATTAAENKTVAAAQSEAEQNRTLLELASHQAKNANSSEGYSTSETASQNKSFTELDNLVDKFAHDHGLTKETSRQLLGSASIGFETSAGISVLGTGATVKGSGGIEYRLAGSRFDRDTWNKAQEFAKQHNFQDVLNTASQAAKDQKYNELSDEGKRLSDSLSNLSEKSASYRQEAAKSLQEAKSFTEQSANVKQNASSINANLNQEYVGWLSNQSLPNSKGAMGIHEAETILSSRPDLDRAYQQSFIEGKTHSYGSNLPKSKEEVIQGYNDTVINKPSMESGREAIESRAADTGLGKEFSLNREPKNEATQKLKDVQDQIEEQTEFLKKEADIRRLKNEKKL